ncbi:hypothetical protein CEXT_514891 [Caerostris extrusa]|uniref:Uncharacterized protein n=1 Tax=Caerostris extrusa TaxID=172846 RepID=A0AAV4SJ86_CAEEX|nr:hypothetical protein CEXT_514891 [Caerostris extrusa]
MLLHDDKKISYIMKNNSEFMRRQWKTHGKGSSTPRVLITQLAIPRLDSQNSKKGHVWLKLITAKAPKLTGHSSKS